MTIQVTMLFGFLFRLIHASFAIKGSVADTSNVITSDDFADFWHRWPVPDGYELIELKIPPPSGIIFSEQIHEEVIHRIGRIEHSVISIRPSWAEIFGSKNVLQAQECKEIVQSAEEYAAINGGWQTTRHATYPTTG